MLRSKVLWVSVFILAVFANTASATGMLLPKDKSLPPLEIKSHRVAVRIDGSVARTTVHQEFINNTDRQMEATYVFPIPKDAALSDFAMMINGKRQAGKVIEAGKARSTYEQIVRQMRDPGLIEYMDCGLLKMRVFPIAPRSVVKLDLSFSNPLKFESGVYEYVFPLKTGTRASKVREDFTVTVHIAGKQPIKNVYSPTHEIGVSRKDDLHAVAGFEQTGAMLDTNFRLFYALSRKDFGLNLLTHRVAGQDGYFALMLAPGVEITSDKVMPKDVCFVLDTSGSMQEQNRMASARAAIKFCLQALNKDDRFALVTFSSGVDTFGKGLTTADKDSVAAAVAFVDKLEARGGTALCDAVTTALKIAPESTRPYLTVLITDGIPTVGTTDAKEILKKVEAANQDNIRVFTFGIAQNLDVPLLDLIAEKTNGYRQYVAPGKETETAVSNFFRKVSNPVLSNLELACGDIKIKDIYPGTLPDLFRGSQVVAFGRYEGGGDVAVQLTGTLAGKKKTFTYDASFPTEQSANDFVPLLWARRKIGYLLDQIRLHGQSQELVDEIVRLSQEHGIATPYTSYLVLENEKAYAQHGIFRPGGRGGMGELARKVAPTDGHSPAARIPGFSDKEADDAAKRLGEARLRADGGGDKDGAIGFSQTLKGLKKSGALSGGKTNGVLARARLQTVAGRRFLLFRGAWIDTAYKDGMKELTVKWGSDAWFAVAEALPKLRPCLALGESMVIVIDGKALLIGPEGDEKTTAAEIKKFFTVK
jgi:Ca-activated chloride channel homolog